LPVDSKQCKTAVRTGQQPGLQAVAGVG
jgi:hypothetical protein